MKKNNIIYIILVTFLVIQIDVFSQNTQEKNDSERKASVSNNRNTLGGLLAQNKVCKRGVYTIESNLKVVKGATLTFEPGCRIFFKPGVVVSIEGGLNLQGIKHNMIEITSEDPSEEGIGFVITGANNEKDIKISYTKINHLLIPLKFEKNWTRNSVSITNNIFQDIITGEPGIIVKSVDRITSNTSIPFVFSKNNFVNNNSRIYLQNIESEVLNFDFSYNLISHNYFYDYQSGIGGNAPVSVVFHDNKSKRKKIEFIGNSFYDNVVRNDSTGAIVRQSNFGVRGAAEQFNLDGNYFGGRLSNDLQDYFDHFTTYDGAPYIVVNSPLLTPSELAHGQICKTLLNGIKIDHDYQFAASNQKLNLQVFSNRLYLLIEGLKFVTYNYYDGSQQKMISHEVECTYVLDQDNKKIDFDLNDEIYIDNHIGYITIKGLRDEEGFEIPSIHIGKEWFDQYMIDNDFKITAE